MNEWWVGCALTYFFVDETLPEEDIVYHKKVLERRRSRSNSILSFGRNSSNASLVDDDFQEDEVGFVLYVKL